MLMPYPRIRWPEAMELDSQTVHAICEGVQAPHGKVETLCQGAHVVDALCEDRANSRYDILRVVSYTDTRPHIIPNYEGNS